MATRYESLKMIGDRLLRSNVMKGISWDFIIDSVIDFMDIVGAPSLFEDKHFEGKIHKYRVKLPCDFVSEKQVVMACDRSQGAVATYATDTFHKHYNKTANLARTYTYSIDNGYLFASIEKGCIEMSYEAVKTDDEGYPMIPSDRNFTLALERYIRMEYFTLLWDNGKIEDKRLENAKQEYAWAVGRLETRRAMLSLGKAEAMFNTFRTLVPRDNEFAKRFANTGNKQFIKRH